MTTPPTPSAGLRVGYVPGVILTKWRDRWAERFPRLRLEVTPVESASQRAALDAGEVDLCFVRLPIDAAGLHVIRLYEEQPVAWFAKDHLLAALDELSVADLVDETVLAEADQVAIDRVAAGVAVLRVPLSVARLGQRKDLVHRPVVDAPTTTVALAWRTDNTHGLIEEFIGIVRGRTANSSRTQAERTARRSTPQAPKRPTERRPPSNARHSDQKPRRRKHR